MNTIKPLINAVLALGAAGLQLTPDQILDISTKAALGFPAAVYFTVLTYYLIKNKGQKK